MTPLELLSDGTVIERGNFRPAKVVLSAKGPRDIEAWARDHGASSLQDLALFLDEARANLLKAEVRSIAPGGSLPRSCDLLWVAMELFARKPKKKRKERRRHLVDRKFHKHVFKFRLLIGSDMQVDRVRTQGRIIYDLLSDFCRKKGSMEFTHDDACRLILDNMRTLDTVQNPAVLWRYFRRMLQHVRLVKPIGRRYRRSKLGRLLEEKGEEASREARERLMLECGEDVIDLEDHEV